MAKIISIAILVLLIGCSDSKTKYVEVVKEKEVVKDCPTLPSSFTEPLTPKGQMEFINGRNIYIPYWLSLRPDLKKLAVDEIENTIPQADSRIPAGSKGVPLNFTIYIQDPGSFSLSFSPTGLATGMTNIKDTIWVAWRANSSDSIMLPALAHELRHVYTLDENAGH